MLLDKRQYSSVKWREGRIVLLALLGLLLGNPVVAWGDAQGSIDADPTATSGISSASGDSAVRSFRDAAELLYKSVQDGDKLESLRRMQQTERGFLALRLEGLTSVEGVQALSNSIAGLKRQIVSVSPDHQRWKTAAAEVRLAADALANPGEPMWHRYRAVVLDDLNSLDKALKSEGASSLRARSAFQALNNHYRLIRTAVLLSTEPFVAERADSAMAYASRVMSAAKADAKLTDNLIPALTNALEGVFPNKDEEPTVSVPASGPTWGWSAMIGSIVVAMLTWVGWRRYRSDMSTGVPALPKRGSRRDPADRWMK
ncbi:sporulation protein YpjB [Cohnella faecalis]|uniref:sporulation protein YpjB n=1 Tax=Cohnella faecalis TaxID=2315694 RepID=UPI001313E7D8|nr:sporulation protein YpjB [Cohnella faecalis]